MEEVFKGCFFQNSWFSFHCAWDYLICGLSFSLVTSLFVFYWLFENMHSRKILQTPYYVFAYFLMQQKSNSGTLGKKCARLCAFYKVKKEPGD
jgi:hypothetical protein